MNRLIQNDSHIFHLLDAVVKSSEGNVFDYGMGGEQAVHEMKFAMLVTVKSLQVVS